MLARLATPFLLLNGVTAFVLFTHSVMYDMKDFVDHRNLSLPSFCSNPGCAVFVAKPSFDQSWAANLKIVSKSYAFDYSDLLTLSNVTNADGSKQPMVLPALPAGESWYIENSNDQQADACLMTVYAVSTAAPNYDSSAVYDSGNAKIDAITKPIIMLMSVFETTIEIPATTTPNSVVMRTTGFDNADGKADNCNYVYDSKSSGSVFPGVQQQLINTQIITLKFENVNNIVIKGGLLMTWNYYLDSAPYTGFVFTDGYIGCSKAGKDDDPNSLEKLRSGNFASETFYFLMSNGYPFNVHFDWDLNTPSTNPVLIEPAVDMNAFSTYGLSHEQTSSEVVGTNIKNVKISSDNFDTDTFMGRFTMEPLGVTLPNTHESTTSGASMTSALLIVSLIAAVMAMSA